MITATVTGNKLVICHADKDHPDNIIVDKSWENHQDNLVALGSTPSLSLSEFKMITATKMLMEP